MPFSPFFIPWNMEMLPVILLIVIVCFAVFGKPLRQKIDGLTGRYPSIKPLVYIVSVLLAIIIGFVYAHQLVEFMIFGVWLFMFLIALTLFVGVIDVFRKTHYFKYPGILTLLLLVTYLTATLLEGKS